MAATLWRGSIARKARSYDNVLSVCRSGPWPRYVCSPDSAPRTPGHVVRGKRAGYRCWRGGILPTCYFGRCSDNALTNSASLIGLVT